MLDNNLFLTVFVVLTTILVIITLISLVIGMIYEPVIAFEEKKPLIDSYPCELLLHKIGSYGYKEINEYAESEYLKRCVSEDVEHG